MSRNKRYNRPIPSKQKRVIKMFEFLLEYSSNGLFCFMTDTCDVPDMQEISEMLAYKYGDEGGNKSSGSSKTNLPSCEAEHKLIAAEVINEPIRDCGGVERIRQQFSKFKQDEEQKCREQSYRINDFEVLVIFSRLGGSGEFSDITSYSRYSGYDIRTLAKHKNDALKIISYELTKPEINSENNNTEITQDKENDKEKPLSDDISRANVAL